MTEKLLLKDQLFNRAKVQRIAGEIADVFPAFKKLEFTREVLARFVELELKARIGWIAECLKKYLPADYRRAVKILLKSLPPPNNPDLADDDFGDFIHAPYAEFVARNGCTREHLVFSLEALYEITQRFSAEDAIRSFINAFPKETLKMLLGWTKDSHYHVRRLCSEGTRPKLPWANKINIPVTAAIPILDRLYADKTRFVTRSVANHINDISKIDPELALETLARWKKSGKQKQAEMDYMTRHGLRTLIKQGHPAALETLGYSRPSKVKLSRLVLPQEVRINTALEFSFTVIAVENTRVMIDYIIYFQNKAGKLNNKKVYKLTSLDLKKNDPVIVSKRHPLRGNMTTRTLYPGQHEVEIQVNGLRLLRQAFLLK